MDKLRLKIIRAAFYALLCLFLTSIPAAAQPGGGPMSPGDKIEKYIQKKIGKGARDYRKSNQGNYRGDDVRHDGRGMRDDPRYAHGHDSSRHDRRGHQEYERGYDRDNRHEYERRHDRGQDQNRPGMRRDGRPDGYSREPGNRDFRGQNPRQEPERNYRPHEGRDPDRRGPRFGGPDRRPEF